MRTRLKDYSDNEVRAATAYKDVFVQTSGIVSDVKKDMIGGAYIVLDSGEFLEMPRVQCTLDKAQEKKAASLSKGARVTIRGRVSGLMIYVRCRNCEFVGVWRASAVPEMRASSATSCPPPDAHGDSR